MPRQPKKPPPRLIKEPLDPFSDDEGDNQEEIDDEVFAPPTTFPAVRPTERRTNTSLTSLLDDTTADVAVVFDEADADGRSDAGARNGSVGSNDGSDIGHLLATENVDESKSTNRAFRRASTGSLIVVRPWRAVDSSDAAEGAGAPTAMPPPKTAGQSRASSPDASEAAVSDVEEEISHTSLNSTSEDDWPEYMPTARAFTATAPQKNQATKHSTTKRNSNTFSGTKQLRRSTRIMNSPEELATTYFKDLAPRSAKVNAAAQMKAQAQQVNQVIDASESSSDDGEGASGVESEDDTLEKALPRSLRDTRKIKSRRQRAGDDVESLNEEDSVLRRASSQLVGHDDDDEPGARGHRAKGPTRPIKKAKGPLTTSWVRDSLSTTPSRGEKVPNPASREDSPSLSVSASPGQFDVQAAATDPDPATVLNVLKRLRNITEYLDLWTYRCEILAEAAEEQRTESRSLYLLMEQARKNWQVVSSERMEKVELMRYLSPEEVMLCKDWRELLAPVTLFQELDVDGPEQEAEELDD